MNDNTRFPLNAPPTQTVVHTMPYCHKSMAHTGTLLRRFAVTARCHGPESQVRPGNTVTSIASVSTTSDGRDLDVFRHCGAGFFAVPHHNTLTGGVPRRNPCIGCNNKYFMRWPHPSCLRCTEPFRIDVTRGGGRGRGRRRQVETSTTTFRVCNGSSRTLWHWVEQEPCNPFSGGAFASCPGLFQDKTSQQTYQFTHERKSSFLPFTS